MPTPNEVNKAKAAQRKRQRDRLVQQAEKLRGIISRDRRALRIQTLALEDLLAVTELYLVASPEEHASGEWVTLNIALASTRAKAVRAVEEGAARMGENPYANTTQYAEAMGRQSSGSARSGTSSDEPTTSSS